jgi:para-nitrobenzyl esterase
VVVGVRVKARYGRTMDSEIAPTTTLGTGPVRGFGRDGVDVYRGVAYGAPTSADGRFAPPRMPESWSQIRSSLFYGPVAPSFSATSSLIGRDHDEDNYLLYRGSNGCASGEDCLRANVWAPHGDGSRPVMVYLHGGGFESGSGNDLLAYDGTNLAANHDVVVVTANHRLNAFGFLDLASLELRGYENHVNVGMQDLVLLLEWVRDNAAAFGGDPGNVTVFGQSGGGIKIATLMAMPAASGLFHRAIIQSGSMTDISERDDSHELTLGFLRELGVDPADPSAAQRLPVDRVIDAVQEFGAVWAPTVDGRVVTEALLGDPRAPSSPLAASVPLIIGTTASEFVSGVDNPSARSFTIDQLESSARSEFGDNAGAVIDRYRRIYPNESPFGLHSIISAWWTRRAAVDQLKAKRRQGGTAHGYLFAWPAPVVDERITTYHACEIAYAFDNAELCINQTGGGPVARQVASDISAAWAAFARNGDPNHPGIPRWTPWAEVAPQTMVFDAPSRIVADLDSEILRLTNGLAARGMRNA